MTYRVGSKSKSITREPLISIYDLNVVCSKLSTISCEINVCKLLHPVLKQHDLSQTFMTYLGLTINV